ATGSQSPSRRSGPADERVGPGGAVVAGEGAGGDGQLEDEGDGLVAEPGVGCRAEDLGRGRGGGGGRQGVGVARSVRGHGAAGTGVAGHRGDRLHGDRARRQRVRPGRERRRRGRDVPAGSGAGGVADVEGLGGGRRDVRPGQGDAREGGGRRGVHEAERALAERGRRRRGGGGQTGGEQRTA